MNQKELIGQRKFQVTIPTKRRDKKFCPAGTKGIPLYNFEGVLIAKAIVDREDFHRVSCFSWSMHESGRAFRWDRGKFIYLHRVILNTTEKDRHVKFRNGDRLDCRKSNLYSYKINKGPDGKVWRWVNLKRTYGLTQDEYNLLVAAQDNRCAICGKTPSKKDVGLGTGRVPVDQRDLCVDHCHKTDSIRGLLCWRCNVGLGNFLDDPVVLRRAAKYLEKAR